MTESSAYGSWISYLYVMIGSWLRMPFFTRLVTPEMEQEVNQRVHWPAPTRAKVISRGQSQVMALMGQVVRSQPSLMTGLVRDLDQG